MADTYENGYRESRERFERETAQHELTILRDDGLYRHLRFQRPGSVFYWYDLVTWPGRLVVCGDAGDWMFTRSRDMFEFFEASGGRINPDYWGEKLRGAVDGRASARRYSPEAFESRLRAWAAGATEEWGEHEEVYPSLLRGALEREVFYDRWAWPPEYGTYDSEEQAGVVLAALEDDGVVGETSEWDLREWDWSFLWCCWAIVNGIARYRAAKSNATPDRHQRTAPHGDALVGRVGTTAS